MKTATFFINPENIENAKNKLIAFNKKAKKYNFKPATYELVGKPFIQSYITGYNQKEYYELQELKVSYETPIINGFSVIAIREKLNKDILLIPIENKELNENILNFHQENKIMFCGHCNTNRQRKKTFLVYNQKEGKIIEVGKSCLKDFTGHDISSVFSFQSFFSELSNFEKIGGRKIDYADTVKNILSQSIAILRKTAFISESQKKQNPEKIKSTKDLVIDELFFQTAKYPIQKQDIEKAEKIQNFFSSLNPVEYNNNQYIQRLILLAMVTSEVSQISLVCSMVPTYEKENGKKDLSFIGEIKDKLEISVIFTGYSSFHNGYGITEVLRFDDENGNKIVSFYTGTKELPEINDKLILKGTVKKQEFYNNIPQTILTRVSWKKG